MLNVLDTLVAIGLTTVSLGTIQEADGEQSRTFWLRNAGTQTVNLRQGYTSCGCTTILFDQGRCLSPGDTASVTLRFNPRGKGGEFMETGTLVYAPVAVPKGDNAVGNDNRLTFTLSGTCIASEETLLRQFPIRVNDNLRLSVNRFDVGRMRVGQTCKRTVVVLHRDEGDRREPITVNYTPDARTTRGLHHIERPVVTRAKGREVGFTVTFDVFIL